MIDIAAFLRARLDEDEAVAQRATPGPWVRDALDIVPEGEHSGHTVAEECYSDADADHIAHHDPAHVLADIASKRLIIDVVPLLREPRSPTPDRHGITSSASSPCPTPPTPTTGRSGGHEDVAEGSVRSDRPDRYAVGAPSWDGRSSGLAGQWSSQPVMNSGAYF